MYRGQRGWVNAKYLSTFTCTLGSSAHTNAPGSSKNKIHNIGLASQTINNLVLYPGETFSALGILGDCNKEKGYKDAPVIVGSSLVDAPGGGVCQVTTTINMAVKQLGISTKAIKHTGGVSYAKPEDEATISYSSGKNLSFTNTLDYPIVLELNSSDGSCVCNVYLLK